MDLFGVNENVAGQTDRSARWEAEQEAKAIAASPKPRGNNGRL